MRTASIAISALFVAFSVEAQAQMAAPNYVPPVGYVPDAANAKKIAAAIGGPIHGEAQIASEKPYVATLKGDVWTVEGTLNCPTKRCAGGVALAEISQRTSTISRVIHSQ